MCKRLKIPKYTTFYKGHIINVSIYQCFNCLLNPVCKYVSKKVRYKKCAYQQWFEDYLVKYFDLFNK